MNEIRWHGRGGQGAKTVSQLLAQALLLEGYHVQAFPEYGPERSGAPMQAYTRSDNRPIRLHCGITKPDVAVVLDASLIGEVKITGGLNPDGFALINSKVSSDEIRQNISYPGNIYTIDADRLAREAGIQYSNVVMSGAVSAIMGFPQLKEITQSAKDLLGGKLPEQQMEANITAIDSGYQSFHKSAEEVS